MQQTDGACLVSNATQAMPSESTEPPERTLTVYCKSGLANRLRVLLSGHLLAETSRRTFSVVWQRERTCAATFSDLFEPDGFTILSAVPARDPSGRKIRWRDYYVRRPDDLLIVTDPYVYVRAPCTLIQPQTYPEHRFVYRRYAASFALLTPVSWIRRAVDEFVALNFESLTIGVHVRRGDLPRFLHQRGEAAERHLAAIFEKVDTLCAHDSGAAGFVASDDGAPFPDAHENPSRAQGVLDLFRDRYGSRVRHTQPRSLRRSSTEAIQDALIDLLLLRKTAAIVGTDDSSFSILAALGRPVPAFYV